MRTRKREPGAGGIAISRTSPASSPASLTRAPTWSPVTRPERGVQLELVREHQAPIADEEQAPAEEQDSDDDEHSDEHIAHSSHVVDLPDCRGMPVTLRPRIA
jgi:hypothetical protein